MSVFGMLYLFIIGAAVGSFLNVLIDRLPVGESILGRSHCDHCGRLLSASDLVPLFSFILLRAKCRTCKKNLSFQYPAVELLTGAAFVFVWISAPHFVPIPWYPVERILYLVLISTVIALGGADMKYHILPDSLQIILFLCAAGFLIAENRGVVELIIQGLIPFFTGAFGTVVPILLLFLMTKGKGMGFGDVKLAFSMGALLGFWGGVAALYVAFLTGGAVGAVLLLTRKRKAKSVIAFGPFLLLGMLISLWFPPLSYLIQATLSGQ